MTCLDSRVTRPWYQPSTAIDLEDVTDFVLPIRLVLICWYWPSVSCSMQVGFVHRPIKKVCSMQRLIDASKLAILSLFLLSGCGGSEPAPAEKPAAAPAASAPAAGTAKPKVTKPAVKGKDKAADNADEDPRDSRKKAQ